MNTQESIISVLQNCTNFSGRASRPEFIGWEVANALQC